MFFIKKSAGITLWHHKRNNKKKFECYKFINNRIYQTIQLEQICCQDKLSQDSNQDLGISIKRKTFRKLSEIMEGLCFALSVTGLRRHNTG
jgi:hypothetical protein